VAPRFLVNVCTAANTGLPLTRGPHLDVTGADVKLDFRYDLHRVFSLTGLLSWISLHRTRRQCPQMPQMGNSLPFNAPNRARPAKLTYIFLPLTVDQKLLLFYFVYLYFPFVFGSCWPQFVNEFGYHAVVTCLRPVCRNSSSHRSHSVFKTGRITIHRVCCCV
jgi:hypothetical protein